MVKKRIKEVVKTLGIEKKDIYTLGELIAIAKETNEPLIEVMRYLRDR